MNNTRNHFSGTLPTQLGHLRLLRTFRASFNQVSGTLPPELKGLQALEQFDALNNQMSGTLPEIFSDLKRLELWDTFGNPIGGDLPQSMINASNLRYLFVQAEQALFVANARCQLRVPGVADHAAPRDPRLAQEEGKERNKASWAPPYSLIEPSGFCPPGSRSTYKRLSNQIVNYTRLVLADRCPVPRQYNWYQLAADYFRFRDAFASPGDGGLPYHCVNGTEEGCNGRSDCDPGVDHSCPGVDDYGLPKRYSLSTEGIAGGIMFQRRWAGVLHCVDKFDVQKTFLPLCEEAGDCHVDDELETD